MNQRRFRLAIAHGDDETGIGIEEYKPENYHAITQYIASIYLPEHFTRNEGVAQGLRHISSLLSADDTALVKIVGRNFHRYEPHWKRIDDRLRLKATYKDRAFSAIDLAQDALKDFRKNTIEERLSLDNFEKGTIKFYHGGKGYGFIKSEKGAEIFFHFSGLSVVNDQQKLADGVNVEFTVDQTDRGPKATNIVIVTQDGE